MGLIAARTDKDAKAAHGISLFLVDTRDHPGFKKGKTLKKIGQPTYDTAEVTIHVTLVILKALNPLFSSYFSKIFGYQPRQCLVDLMDSIKDSI